MGTAAPNNDTPTHTNHPETEKERTARLLREAREKSALAKEKKKSKKSKKHDKWIKEQEAEKARRAKGWYVYMSMYVFYFSPVSPHFPFLSTIALQPWKVLERREA